MQYVLEMCTWLLCGNMACEQKQEISSEVLEQSGEDPSRRCEPGKWWVLRVGTQRQSDPRHTGRWSQLVHRLNIKFKEKRSIRMTHGFFASANRKMVVLSPGISKTVRSTCEKKTQIFCFWHGKFKRSVGHPNGDSSHHSWRLVPLWASSNGGPREVHICTNWRMGPASSRRALLIYPKTNL